MEAKSPLKVIRTECLGQDATSHTTLSRTEFLLGKFDNRLFPWNEKSITSTCTVNLLDIQYPAKINRYRIYIDADLHYQCQPELWRPIFTDVSSMPYEWYEENVANEIKDLLKDIRYRRVLDEFKVAYFYPHEGMTRVAIHLDFIKQQVDQKASKEEVVENIRTRRRRKGNCKGLSILPVKISTETGFWENPDETPENYAKVTLEGPLRINYERQPWNKDIGNKFSPEYEKARNMVLKQMFHVEKTSKLTFRGLSIDRFRRAQGNVSVVVNLFLKKTLLLRTDLERSLLFNILADLDAPDGLDPEATKISGLALSEVVEKSPEVVQTNVSVISLHGLVSSGDSVNPSSDYANRNTVTRLIDQLTDMVENLELQFAPGNKGFWINNAHEFDKWRFKVYFYVTASSVGSLGSVKMAIIKIKSKLGNSAGYGKLRADSTKIDIEQNVKNPLPGQYFTYLDGIYPSGKSLFLEPKRNKRK
ncbi:hypothetical protein FGIG_10050 [Fasciola gigantica]|uniref:Uncharacterized protein n=1 Tax=Fasciola gigantica TaxID=46835 RepID=A0A504YSP1_FASGI|nr:hypothetical protein FGIG_10050 [Fasciola gigantica]